MTDSKKRNLIIFLSVIALLLAGVLCSEVHKRSMERELRDQIGVYALQNEAAAAKIRAEMNALKASADAYDAHKAELSERVTRYLSDYNAALLVLVNQSHPLPPDYAPQLVRLDDKYLIDRRCAAELIRMIDDCRAAGNHPVLCSAYRTQEYQQELYDNKIKRLLAAGYNPDDTPSLAAQSVAPPGTSEHQLGLAVDIRDEYNVYLDESQERTGTQKWLMANCTDYGFLLRYPNGSSEITGIIYEPWHYRYVGKAAAKEITERGVTLEEYLQFPEGT